jgi:hypothetical protein
MLCYFHLVHTDERILDETGIEVADLEAARYHAIKAILETRNETLSAHADWTGWHLKVVDEAGSVLLLLPLDALQD